jgi:transcriptional regulator with XRE-family HTH domain
VSEVSGFADLLRGLRAEAGLTQAALAERAGLGLSTVQQYEQGWREPTYGVLVKLAEGLGVSLQAFHPRPSGTGPGAAAQADKAEGREAGARGGGKRPSRHRGAGGKGKRKDR